MPFQFKRLAIPELILVKPQRFEDSRGYFVETYRETQFAENGITAKFVQDNYSHSAGRVLRGLHYQKNPRAQGKLVMVITGKVFDVAVDIRRGSPTHGKWIGVRIVDPDQAAALREVHRNDVAVVGRASDLNGPQAGEQSGRNVDPDQRARPGAFLSHDVQVVFRVERHRTERTDIRDRQILIVLDAVGDIDVREHAGRQLDVERRIVRDGADRSDPVVAVADVVADRIAHAPFVVGIRRDQCDVPGAVVGGRNQRIPDGHHLVQCGRRGGNHLVVHVVAVGV